MKRPKTPKRALKIIIAFLTIALVFSVFSSLARAKDSGTVAEENQSGGSETGEAADAAETANGSVEPVSEEDADGDGTAPAVEPDDFPVSATGSSDPLPPVSPSDIGGAFSSLMKASFKTDLATGSATLNVPIVAPPGRKNVQPNIGLSYSSGNSNGICGMGWSIPVSAIQRSTKYGVPQYTEDDIFIAGGEELVPIGAGEYRAKLESSFTKYVYESSPELNCWTAFDKSGTQYRFGLTPSSRAANPNDPDKVFAWYIDSVTDVYGNTVIYEYEQEDNSVYLKYIYYTANTSSVPAAPADKRVEFVYEGSERPDKIYNNRAGWPSVIKRRLGGIKISIDYNKDSAWGADEVVWIYNLSYEQSPDTTLSLLVSVQLEDGEGNTLPAKTFIYQTLEP